MALESVARNLFSAVQFGDVSLVFVKIRNTAIVAGESSPDTTVAAPGSGVYNLTFPSAQYGWVVSTVIVGAGATDRVAEVVAFSATAGTCQIDTGSDLGGGDECHMVFALVRN